MQGKLQGGERLQLLVRHFSPSNLFNVDNVAKHTPTI